MFKSKKGKALVWGFVSLLVMLSFLTGCGSTSTSNKKDGKWAGQTITVQMIGSFKLQDSTDPISGQKIKGLQALKDEFEKEHPGATVNIVTMPWDGYIQKTKTMVTGNQADVYQMPGLDSGYAREGDLEPLQKYIDKDHFDLSKYVDNTVEGWETVGPDGKKQIYGLPVFGDTRFILYDKKIFKDYGVKDLPEHPTMDDIMNAAKQMTGKDPVTGQQTYGVYFNGQTPEFLITDIAEGLGGSWGSGLNYKDMKFDFNSPQYQKALNWLISLEPFAPKGITSNQGSEKWLTKNNNIAIMLDQGPGSLITKINAQGLQDRIGIVQQFKNDKGVGGLFAGSPFVMAKSSKHKDLAWEWIKFSSSDFFQKYLWEQYNNIPVIKSAYTDWQSIKDEKQFMDPILQALSTPWTPHYPWVNAEPRNDLSSGVQGALTGKMTAKQALDKIEQQSNDWLKQQNQ
ncbi:extracellular solute-binding protein [Pullulanibacillus sp. KACC 23026]|uniref:ABC transporter substrate-binding protein n=1 Tax=Pullulanibacillus sp. KACC 23026 TaxID=3028315 RepID=UPI0023B09DD3|nr:extracellular solute-binding protein [Pullulanibacillus sp. KACC 23026]WEG13692.1 extracellular solute-binding protein [Pullulanibacillus sp. KACC 23026]